MAELVTCPECEGRGTIKLPPRENENPAVEGNLTNFLEKIGMAAKKKKPPNYKTCPRCNGFGMVRAKIDK